MVWGYLKTPVPEGSAQARQGQPATRIAPRPTKYAGKNAHIGFHGAYNVRTGQQTPLGLALQGALLGHLDYSYEAILWIVSPRALDMNWLTPEIAEKLGIYLQYDKTFPPGPPRLYDYSPPAPKPEPRTAAKRWALWLPV